MIKDQDTRVMKRYFVSDRIPVLCGHTGKYEIAEETEESRED